MIGKTNQAGHCEKVCPHCGTPFSGKPGRHVERCGQAVKDIFGTRDLSPADWCLIGRAGAHVTHAALLEPAQRLRGRVTELDVARLIRSLESGVQVYRGGRFTWTSSREHPMRPDMLALTVVEGIRTELLITEPLEVRPGLVRARAVRPAPVHLSGVDNLRPRCDQRGDRGARRWRLVRNRSYADCPECLSLA